MNKFLSITKTWRDKANGNTYFSTQVYNQYLDVAFVLPMQYGYGDMSESMVFKKLDEIKEQGLLDSKISSINEDADPTRIIVKFIKIDECKKKEVKQHGGN